MFIQINQRNKYTEILQCLKIDFFPIERKSNSGYKTVSSKIDDTDFHCKKDNLHFPVSVIAINS